MGLVHNKAWLQLDKKKQKLESWKTFFKKTIDFKVLKTIRNQLKYPVCL